MGNRIKIWVVTVGEPLPIDGPHVRLYRSGILCNLMAEEGHDVTWWSSSFDHVAKTHRATRLSEVSLRSNLNLILLPSLGYRRNVSYRRLRDHAMLARMFRKLVREKEKPDIILVSYPTIELSAEAVKFGQEFDVPVVVDVRDLWPDVFEHALPRVLKPFARSILAPLDRKARWIFRSASAVTGITEKIVEWALKKGGKDPRSVGRSFPFGYDSSRIEIDDVSEALEFWGRLGIGENDWNVCFFGTLGRQIDLEVVINAARRLADSYPQVNFVICGEGDLRDHFQMLANDVPTVIFPGWVDRVQIHSLMEISQLGLAPYLPSHDFLISLPNKPIEYMSAGVPILSTIDGVLGELIRDYKIGVVCDSPTAELIALRISDLVEDPERVSRMKRASLALFRQRFDARLVYGQFSKYLQEIAGNN